jgi:alpha-tubulin suppressor-like RCC1 family protein
LKCCIPESGKVFRWGERLWTTPSAVELKRRVIRVGGGSHASACLDDRGVLWTWGRSNSMVLATGSDVSESQPRAVAALSKQYVTDLFAAGNNMAVLAKPL